MKAIVVSLSAVLLIYIAYRIFRIATLDDNLPALIRKGAVILDVRTASEFAGGHINGSVNISLGEIRQRYAELDKNKTYITCCSHGMRSLKVESLLKERGFRHVYNGGAWSDLEKTVESARQRQSKD